MKVVFSGKVKTISNEKTITGKNGNTYPAMDVVLANYDDGSDIYANCIGKLCEYVKKNADLRANIILEISSVAYKDKHITNIALRNYCPTEYHNPTQENDGVQRLKEKLGGESVKGQSDQLPF